MAASGAERGLVNRRPGLSVGWLAVFMSRSPSMTAFRNAFEAALPRKTLGQIS